MPIYDNDGTANHEIGKLYDNNGSANAQIGKVYDNNGTTNSLIYQSDIIVLNGGTYYVDSGTMGGSPPVTSGSTRIAMNFNGNGYNTLSFTITPNSARVYFWTGGGTVHYYRSWWHIWSGDTYVAGDFFYGPANFVVNISNLTASQKANLQFRVGLEFSVSTVTGSTFSGTWTLSPIIAT